MKGDFRIPERWDTHGQRRLVPMSEDMIRSRSYALLTIVAVVGLLLLAPIAWWLISGWIFSP